MVARDCARVEQSRRRGALRPRRPSSSTARPGPATGRKRSTRRRATC